MHLPLSVRQVSTMRLAGHFDEERSRWYISGFWFWPSNGIQCTLGKCGRCHRWTGSIRNEERCSSMKNLHEGGDIAKWWHCELGIPQLIEAFDTVSSKNGRAHTFETRRRTTWKVIHERCVCILKVSGTLLEHSMEHSASFEYVHSDSTKGTNFWIYYLWILKRWGKYETMSMQSKQTAPVYTKWAQWNLPFSNDWTHNGQGN